jgi:cytochrome c5
MSAPPSTRIVPQYLFVFVAVAVLIVAAGYFVFPPLRPSSPAVMSPEATAARLAPVSTVELASSAPAAAPTLRTGEAVYSSVCVVCHGTGVAGAPKFGDKKAWAPRIAQGFDVLVKHATEGYKAMPPKGGNADLDPQEVARAVAWMADHAGASFKEP